MPIAMIISGGMAAMAGVACTTQIFHLAPDRGRAFFMSLATILMMAGPALSPMLAGYIRQSVPNTWCAFFLGLRLDIFQIMLGAAGVALLVLIVLLAFIEDFQPVRSRGTRRDI